jgi:S-(hydroxymethyl)glutathione dehydrogenase / alcohol dehydrogenase
MRAAILRNTGDTDLEVRDDIELRPIGPGEVRVRITHSGVCHSDLSAMNGTIPQPPPAVLGHEGAGVVEAVGDGVTTVVPGDHCIIAWSPPCGKCKYCVDFKQPQLCFNIMMIMGGQFLQGTEVIGAMAGAGTFAEYTQVPEAAVVKIADDIPLEVAALVGCGVMTGAGAAINTAKVTPGSSVIVYGAGGVGISAIQGARIAGAAEILAVDMNPDKLEEAKAFGATHACTPGDVDQMKVAITGGDGFDFALECIGKPATMRAAYDQTRRGGTTVIVGVGRMDEFVQFSAFELFFNEKTLVGSYYGGTDVRADFHRLLRLYKAGKLHLDRMITRRIKIDEINDALRAMERGEVVRQVIEF